MTKINYDDVLAFFTESATMILEHENETAREKICKAIESNHKEHVSKLRMENFFNHKHNCSVVEMRISLSEDDLEHFKRLKESWKQLGKKLATMAGPRGEL